MMGQKQLTGTYGIGLMDKRRKNPLVRLAPSLRQLRRLALKSVSVKLGWDRDMLKADIPTLEDFTETYIEYVRDIKQNRSWKSAILYLNSLNKRFRKKKLSQITP
ncbi:MAG: hypothetical protein ACTSVM_01990, partial [Candidatus Ranarchaeia archaeon]